MADRDRALRSIGKAVNERARLQRQAHEVLRRAMLEAREVGATWRQIGDAAGMSHVAALKIANQPPD